MLYLSLPSALQLFGREMGSKSRFFKIPTLLMFSKEEIFLAESTNNLQREPPCQAENWDNLFSKNLGVMNSPSCLITPVNHTEPRDCSDTGKLPCQKPAKAKTFPVSPPCTSDQHSANGCLRPDDLNFDVNRRPNISPNICDLGLKNEKTSHSPILKIKNISLKIKKSEILEAFFGQFARILRVIFNQAFGYAFLQVSSEDESDLIIQAFDGRTVFGNSLRISKTAHCSLDFGKFSKNVQNKYEFYESVRSFTLLPIGLVTKPLQALPILVITNVPFEMDPKCFAMLIQQISDSFSMSVTSSCESNTVSYNFAFKSMVAALEVLAVLLGKKINNFTIYHL